MRRAKGFTLTEVLIAVFIVAVLIALLLPAIQTARSATKRVQCVSHLAQLGVSAHGYAGAHREMLPAQGVKRSLGWRYALLPYLEQQTLFDVGATNVGKQTPERTALHTTALPFYQCPATEGYARLIEARGVLGGARDYYALHTFGGSYAPGMWCPLADEAYGEGKTMERASHWRTWPAPLRYTIDGLSNTMMIYESAARGAVMIRDGQVLSSDSSEFDRGWADFQHPWVYADIVLPLSVNERPINVSNISSMYAYHRGGVNALFGDGRVHFLSEATDADVVRALASREGGEASPWEPTQ